MLLNKALDADRGLDGSVGHVSISNDKDAARTVRLEEDATLLLQRAEVVFGRVAGAEAEVRRDLRAGWWHLVLGLVASNECEHLFLARRHGSAIAGLCGLGGAVSKDSPLDIGALGAAHQPTTDFAGISPARSSRASAATTRSAIRVGKI